MTTLAADDSYLWDFAKERKVPTISPSGSLSLNNHYYSGLSVYCFGERHGLTACGKTLIRAGSGKGTTSQAAEKVGVGIDLSMALHGKSW